MKIIIHSNKIFRNVIQRSQQNVTSSEFKSNSRLSYRVSTTLAPVSTHWFRSTPRTPVYFRSKPHHHPKWCDRWAIGRNEKRPPGISRLSKRQSAEDPEPAVACEASDRYGRLATGERADEDVSEPWKEHLMTLTAIRKKEADILNQMSRILSFKRHNFRLRPGRGKPGVWNDHRWRRPGPHASLVIWFNVSLVSFIY